MEAELSDFLENKNTMKENVKLYFMSLQCVVYTHCIKKQGLIVGIHLN